MLQNIFQRKYGSKKHGSQYEADIAQVKAHTPPDRDTFPVMQIGDNAYTEKKEAGQAIIDACKAMKSPEPVALGVYRGLSMELAYSSASQEFVITLRGKGKYRVPLGTDIYGNITRLDMLWSSIFVTHVAKKY